MFTLREWMARPKGGDSHGGTPNRNTDYAAAATFVDQSALQQILITPLCLLPQKPKDNLPDVKNMIAEENKYSLLRIQGMDAVISF